jgi:hypothetical protein
MVVARCWFEGYHWELVLNNHNVNISATSAPWTRLPAWLISGVGSCPLYP